MKPLLPLIALFASTIASAQLADSTGDGRLHFNPPIASEGGSCNTSEVKSDANGNILYCQSGMWRMASTNSNLTLPQSIATAVCNSGKAGSYSWGVSAQGLVSRYRCNGYVWALQGSW